jgi:hypothetical protein
MADLIYGIFTEPVENDVGAADVNFCWMGERKSIIVDSGARFKNSRPNSGRAVAVAYSGWFHNAEKAVANATDPNSSIVRRN